MRLARLLYLIAFLSCVLAHAALSQGKEQCILTPTQNILWNSLTGNNGLSQNSVTSILQDSKGFIWIGTYDGLNRFDGFTTQIQRHESANPNSLSDNRVLCLHEDKEGRLLIGTDGGGLNVFDPSHETFQDISIRTKDHDNNMVTTLCTDRDGNIWAGGLGLAIIPAKADRYRAEDIRIVKELKDKEITKIIRDKAGNIWIGTNDGLYLGTGEGDNIRATPVKGLEYAAITALYQDANREIWIGRNGGLYSAVRKNEAPATPTIDDIILRNRYQEIAPAQKTPADISDITADQAGNIWISSRNQGIIKCSNSGGRLQVLSMYNTSQPFCNISEDMIRVLFVDLSNTLWLGSYRKGVNYFNLSNKNFYSFNPLLSGETGELGYKGKYITAVCECRRDLWVGTYDEGLYRYNKCTGSLNRFADRTISRNIICLYQSADSLLWIGTDRGLYKVTGDIIQEVPAPRIAIRSLCGDKYGRLWIATWNEVVLFDPATNKSRHIDMRNGLCFTLYADPKEEVVWVGTLGGGLKRIAYDKAGEWHLSHYTYNEKDRNSISNNHVWSIYRDSRDVLWVGTDAGLNKCVTPPGSDKISFQPVSDAVLKDRKITAILEDGESNLWLSSSQGLFRYNSTANSAKQYTYKDGLQSNNFTEAAFRNTQGRLYFGGINGLNYFEPEKIQGNPYLPITAIVDLRIFNHSIKAGEEVNGRVILPENINTTGEVRLSYKQNNFQFSFAALHYAVPEDNRFRYRLQGYDKDWIVTGHDQRFATYSNLDAGEYTFYLTSSNNDNLWNNDIRSIKVIVEPAPWFSWWAKTAYALALVAIVMLVFSYFRAKHRFKNELYLEKIEKEKVKELNELRLDVFTNITHEIRTPLNLIAGPIQELIKKVGDYDHFLTFRLKIIQRNTSRLTNLINQVLDLRKISSATERLVISKNELVGVIHEIKRSFDWIAEQKRINFDFNYDAPAIYGWFDRDKVEKVSFNLLSNAFKYIADGGRITLSVSQKTAHPPLETVEITISDNGPGIAPEEQERIFELFYQSPDQKGAGSGSGIGLALSAKLMKMHHGKIVVNSKPGRGASFTMSFPIGKQAYAADELYETSLSRPAAASGALSDPEIAANHMEKPASRRKTILIIEDDDDQRAYIKECLAEEFDVKDEPDADHGFETAARIRPDVIITDLMMPGMNGVALSRKLKADKRTNHIPVIIHSVKNGGTTFEEALEAGADDIIPKPFDYRLLGLKINNLLRSRQDLLASAYRDQLIQPAEPIIPSDDEVLLKTILELVEDNMSDPDFGVEKLARLATMSRMNLHRKLHAITGKTASELIREIRMKKAGRMMASGNMRVTDVMYEVGIASNYHFNKYFREMYGMSAKDFMKKDK